MPLDECRLDRVEAALAGPQEGFGDYEAHPTLAAKAAVLVYRCVKGHACGDGNKRLGLILALTFLDANGHEIDASGEETDHVFRHVAASEAADHEGIMAILTYWFEQSIRPLAEED
jgi:death-on-curing family protein